MTEFGQTPSNPRDITRELRLMDKIRKWLLDPKDDFMSPYMIRLNQRLIICVEMKPTDYASNSMASLTVFTMPTKFHIMAKGILKSAREEDEGVVLLPLYQDGDVEMQGKRAGNYNGQPMTTFHVPLESDMAVVQQVIKTLLQALA